MKASEIVSTNPIEVQKNELVSKLAGKLEKNAAKSAYVMDKKKCLGVFSLTNFLKSRSDISHLKVGHFVKNVAHLSSEDSPTKVAEQMLNSDSFLLPVYQEEEFVGVIDIFDLFSNMQRSKEFSWMKDVYATDLRRHKIAISGKVKISTALTIMINKRLREVLVIDDFFKVLGVLNHGDLLQKYYSFYLRPEHRQKPRTQTRAYEGNPAKISNLPVQNFIVRKEPIYIEKEDNLLNIANLMAKQQVLSVTIKNSLETISAKEVLRKIREYQPREKRLLQFVGLHKIKIDDHNNPLDKRLHTAAELYIRKISRHTNGTFNVVIHIKEHDREGKRSRYEVHTRLYLPTQPITAKTENWNLVTAVRKSFDEILEQMEKRFKKKEAKGKKRTKVEKL